MPNKHIPAVVTQISNLSVSLEIVSLRDDFAGGWYLAKRMECVELAPAFVRSGWSESASKLNALHTLRAIWLRPCRAALYRRFPIGRAAVTADTAENRSVCSPAWPQQVGNLRYSR